MKRLMGLIGAPAVLALVLLVAPLRSCAVTPGPVGPATPVATRERPRPRPTLMVATRVPAPVPIPTLGPDAPGARAVREVWSWGFGAPRAAVLLGAPQTQVFTVVDDGTYWNGDVLLKWRHPNPGSVDYYEVWHSLNAPYFEPGVSGTLEGTTTARRFLSDASGQDFTYNSGPPGAPYGIPGVDTRSGLDTWRIVACNRAGALGGGCAPGSNEVGVVTWSLRQGMADLPR